MPAPILVTLPTGEVHPFTPALSPAEMAVFASWDGTPQEARDLWVNVLAARLGVPADQASAWPNEFWMRRMLLIFGPTEGQGRFEDAAWMVKTTLA